VARANRVYRLHLLATIDASVILKAMTFAIEANTIIRAILRATNSFVTTFALESYVAYTLEIKTEIRIFLFFSSLIGFDYLIVYQMPFMHSPLPLQLGTSQRSIGI
jgi:hypothetical protein